MDAICIALLATLCAATEALIRLLHHQRDRS